MHPCYSLGTCTATYLHALCTGSLCFTGKHKHTNTSLKYRSTNCRIIAGIAAGRCSEERGMKYVPATVSLASPNMPVVTSCHCSCSCCCQCNAVAVVVDDEDDDDQLVFCAGSLPGPSALPSLLLQLALPLLRYSLLSATTYSSAHVSIS